MMQPGGKEDKQPAEYGMKQYRNYIFDLYGTLADIRTDETGPLLWKRTALWFSEHGAAWTGPALKAAYLDRCRQEQESSPDPYYEIELRHVFARLYREKGIDASPEQIEETASFFRIASMKKLRLYSWVKPVFAGLRARGGRLYLLSNAQACFTRPELRFLGLENAFDGMILSSEAGVRKPSPRIMERLLKTYGLSTKESLMIGNDRGSDIALAEAVGMDSFYLETETSNRLLSEPAATFEVLDGDGRRMIEILTGEQDLKKQRIGV